MTALALAGVVTGCHAAVSTGAAQSPTATSAATPAPTRIPAPTQTQIPAPSATASPVTLTGPVVALGDSYTAGALLPMEVTANPVGCLRSSDAYPVLVAAALHASLTNVACASAGVKDLTQPQKTYLGTNPPQLQALARDDSLVLFTLGGDDMGFLNVLRKCAELSVSDPLGSPCKAYYTKGGTDQLAAKVKAEAPKIAAALKSIVADAPHARIAVVGYPDLFPLSGGCWPVVPITDGDIAYLRGIEEQANAMLAADAKAAGAIYVNTFTPTVGHDFCKSSSVQDVEGLIPTSTALPFHPNARGQQAMAAAVLAALKS